MERNALDQTTMTQYLLGLLSEEDRERVEETFFQADASFEQLTAMEDDLFDDYVRGRLPKQFRKAFEEKLKTDARWKERFVFAQALVRRIDQPEIAAGRPAAIASIWQLLRAAFQSHGPVFQVALATSSLALLFGFVWLTYTFQQQQGQLALFQTERSSLESQIAELKQQGQDLNQQLDQERSQRQQLESQQPADRAVGLIASFLIRPGLVRGSADTTILDVPRASEIVRIQLDLDPAENYQSYRAELQTQAGEMVWTGGMLRAGTSGSNKVVVISLPSQMLDSGDYELALKGVSRPGTLEDVGYYYFNVRRR